MSDRLIVILPPVLSDEERIEKALNYCSLSEGDGHGDGYGDGMGNSYGDDCGDGWGSGYGNTTGSGGSSINV
jgi:hypothetical protein